VDPPRRPKAARERRAERAPEVRGAVDGIQALEGEAPPAGVQRGRIDAERAAGRRVACPTLVAWSVHDDLEDLYGDPLAIWRAWAPDLRGARIDSGHHMAEEAPEQLAGALGEFLDGG
jgi:haloacetate dehalogenase